MNSTHPLSLRFVVSACIALWATGMLTTTGCSSESSPAAGTSGTGSGASAVAGASNVTGGSGGALSAGSANGGSAPTGGTAQATGGNGASGSAVTGGSSTGGANAAGGGGTASNGGAGGTASKPCVNVEPPPDPEWPGATCDNWATETTECGAAWFKNYCDVSCGRCVPQGGGGSGSGGSGAGGSGGSAAVDCSTKGLPNVSGGNGYATRYWDCCQPHCAQFDGHRCNQDGTSQTGNTQSSCSGGGSYACYDEAPKAVNDCLSYGYIAKANPNCGQCYRIQFTGEGEHNANDPGSKLIKGKQMIVKVSNTGGDVANNQFDLMIPGGGVGQFNACSKQWGSSDLGAQYGGFLTSCTGSHAQKKDCVRQQCMKIPAGAARDGCIWFVDWLQAADNPKFTSQQTDCPF